MELAQDHTRRIWDERARKGLLHTRTARDDEFAEPLKAINGRGWIDGGLDGKHVLCLAGGGGLQAPLYAAAGARVTVVDSSNNVTCPRFPLGSNHCCPLYYTAHSLT
mgnify:CR=1 FL=1